MRLELTRVSLIVKLANRYSIKGARRLPSVVIYEALCFDVAQAQKNRALNETLTHSCRFASQAC